MTGAIARFEWRYQTRQVAFVAAALLFLGFGFILTAQGFGPDNVQIDSPYSITRSIGFLTLLSLFVLAVFSANAVVRDREYQMEEIVFTTSVGKLEFLVGRFAGSFLAAFTAFALSAAGMFLARFMPWQEAERIGGVGFFDYFWPMLVLALPNIFFAAVVLFAVATITRNVLAAYAASVVLYVLYFVAAAMTNSPLMASSVPGTAAGASLAALLDPFGLSAFFEQTQHWIPAVRNTRQVALGGNFLLNRLLWVGVSFAGLGLVYRVFSFRVLTETRKREVWSAATAVAAFPPPEAKTATKVAALQISDCRAWLATTRTEIRGFVLSRPFLGLALLWAALIVSELVNEVATSEFGVAHYPSDAVLFGTIATPLTIFGLVLIIYYSTEIVWRERTLRFDGILNATPSSSLAFVTSKWTALAILLGIQTAIALAAGAAMQLAKGYPVAPGVLLSFAYFMAMPLVLFALAAVCIQTLSPQKYAGMLFVLALAAVCGTPIASVEHPLLRFGFGPPMSYTDMNGFGRAGGFHLFMLLWASLGALLLLVAATAWRHETSRLRMLRRMPRFAAAALAVVFAGTAAFLFYNTNVINRYQTSDSINEWRAGYERKYRAHATLAQPRIVDVSGAVDLFPDERRYRVRATYTLLNDSDAPMTRVLVAVRRDADAANVRLDGAKLAEHDAEFNQFDFMLARPLPPSGRTKLHFDITYESRGIAAGEPDNAVVENGSYVMTFRAFPTLGYRAGYEIQDVAERRRRGLPAASPRSDQPEIESVDWATFDVTVSTADDQTAVAPGRVVRTWTANGRRLTRFRTDSAIPHQFAIASARYAVKKTIAGGVAVEIYYHPAHTQNIDRMQRAAVDSLHSFRKEFGPYVHPHLRLVEVPAYWNFGGYAQPGVIFFNETRGMLVDARDPRRLDLVTRRVAHEVAHEWWGHHVSAAPAPGATTLTETLTKYAEMLVLQRRHGREQTRESLRYELDLYLKDRTSETDVEPPLTRATYQSYVYYRKGAIVMAAIQDLIGEAVLNTALRNYAAEQGGPNRTPTTAHLMRHLRAAAPPATHGLIDEWMNDVVLYDLSVLSADARLLPSGRYETKLRISASKSRDDGKPLPLRENIGIEVAPGYFAKHELREGVNEIVVVTKEAPQYAAVDPDILRVDRNPRDNSSGVRRP